MMGLVVTACTTAPEDAMSPPAAKSSAPPMTSTPTPSSTTSPSTQVDPALLRPHREVVGTFAPGIALDQPAAALWAAIAAPALAGRRLIVPVQVELELHMVRRVRLGFGADAPVLPVDDSRLGIGLADRTRQRCPDRTPCTLWLVGVWETASPLGEARFVVRQVGDGIAAGEATGVTHILVEQRAD
jgi:hypothetical protein